MAKKKRILTEKGMVPKGPYSQGWIAGDFCIVAAHCAFDPETGEIIGDTFEEQFDQVMNLIIPVLEEAGCTLKDVARMGVFLKDMSLYDEYNRVYAKYFPDPAPARCTVGAGTLPPRALVQMEALAVIPDRS